MIEPLTEERLKEIGIEDSISNISIRINGHDAYVAIRDKRQILTGIDAFRVYYFRNREYPAFPLWEADLVPEYFSLSLNNHLQEHKDTAKSIYNEDRAVKLFIKDQIIRTNRNIEVNETMFKKSSLRHKGLATERKVYEHYLGWLEDLLKEVEKSPSLINKYIRSQSAEETFEENDLIMSTIEDWYFPYKEKLSPNDYQRLTEAYYQYCTKHTFPKLDKPITFRGQTTKKVLGWAIHEILDFANMKVNVEVLTFSYKNLSVFSEDAFDPERFRRSNIYKYHTTKAK